MQTGHLNITYICCGGAETVCLINCYGWTNGHNCKTASSRTDALFLAIQAEHPHMPSHPTIIMGDFNANVDDLPT